ncbi:MAG: hypothetical protein M3527_02035, partial [Actinomycetota bacterium]|nr:hypothetical protein [Actinomycetota bacterium]
MVIGTAVLGTGAPAAPAPTQTIQVGTAKATAVTLRAAPAVGSLELAVTSGASVAEVRNQLAQSQSQAANLGLLGSALVGEQCDGKEATVREEQLPHPIRVDNREGDAALEDAGVPLAGSTLSGIYQQVRASAQPLSEAITTTGQAELAGLLQLRGGRATAVSEVVDGGAARVAHATVTFDLELPGVLSLSGLRWDAFHRTGTEPDAHAAFTIGSASLLGVPVPTEGLPATDVLAQLNPVLSTLGVTILPPVVERFTEPADLVRVTPMRIRFSESPVGALLLGPVLDATRQLRDDAANTLVETDCHFAAVILVTEVLLGQASGTGSMNVDLGGAEA